MAKPACKIDWNNEDVKTKFISMYTEIGYGIYRYTFEDIMKEFGIGDRSTVTNAATRYGLEKRDGKFFNKKNSISYEQRKYIVEHYRDYTIQEFATLFNIKERNVTAFIRSQNLTPKYDNPQNKYEQFMLDESFVKDYNNLFLSNTYIANKYGLNNKTVLIWRTNDFGDQRKWISKMYKKTNPELLMEDILYELEIPFFYEWSIDKWNIDYYLGHKLCIEVNGDYYHSNSDYVKNKDVEKIEWLEKNDYTILVFTETEMIENKEYVKNKLLETIGTLYRNV